MRADIITIGDEILIGQITDTNSAYIARELNAAGIRIRRKFSIGDQKEAITAALDESIGKTDAILFTGGLGPTNDDITKHTLAAYFNSELVFNEEAYKNIEAIFARRNLKVTELNRLQAYLPDKCKVIPNLEGTACGMLFRKNDSIIISMPGVPYEMKTMMEKFILILNLMQEQYLLLKFLYINKLY
ncbi:MAG: competence/damage-inducible protein A [Bacteroidia bacterium]